VIFKHFILTRYALRFDRVLDEAWFAHRLPLFHQTIGAVERQNDPAPWHLVWLLFYSPEYEALVPTHEQSDIVDLRWIPVHHGNFEEANAEMRAAMAAWLTKETHVLSTRLDNDDLIAPDFCRLVQEAAARLDPDPVAFINFDVGQNKLANGEVIEHVHRTNMFQTAVEKRAGFRGIFTWAHNSTPLIGPLVHLPWTDQWTHVEHERNVWPVGRAWDGPGRASL
jgi:hypothetical protein